MEAERTPIWKDWSNKVVVRSIPSYPPSQKPLGKSTSLDMLRRRDILGYRRISWTRQWGKGTSLSVSRWFWLAPAGLDPYPIVFDPWEMRMWSEGLHPRRRKELQPRKSTSGHQHSLGALNLTPGVHLWKGFSSSYLTAKYRSKASSLSTLCLL